MGENLVRMPWLIDISGPEDGMLDDLIAAGMAQTRIVIAIGSWGCDMWLSLAGAYVVGARPSHWWLRPWDGMVNAMD